MASTYNEQNPILCIYRGIQIRKYNAVTMRVDEVTYKEIIDAELDTGLSKRAVLGHSSKPCHACQGINIVIYDEQGEPKEIKRGILSKRIPEGSGTNHKKKHLPE